MNDDDIWTISAARFHKLLKLRGITPATLSEEELKAVRSLFMLDEEIDDLLRLAVDRALAKVLARRRPGGGRAPSSEAVVWRPTRLGEFSDAFDNYGVDESALTEEHLHLLRDAWDAPEVEWQHFEATVEAVKKVIDSLPRLDARPPDDLPARGHGPDA